MSTERDRHSQPKAGRLALQGAALLGGAALLSKLIGTLQKIPVQNLAGDEVFGLYSAVYALAIMWMTLAAAGIPTAVSVLVAESEADGDTAGAQRIVRWSLVLLGASGLAAFAVMQACAPLFAGWIGVPEAADAIRASAIALLFAPAAAVLRGWRQGQMRMARPALSQVIEQTARVAFMLAMLAVAIQAGWQAATTTAALHGGLAAGAAAGLAVMLWPSRRIKEVWIDKANRSGSDGAAAGRTGLQAAERRLERYGAATETAGRRLYLPKTGAALVRRIVGVALPVAAASIVVPLFGLIDALTIPRLMQQGGIQPAVSMAEFGVYNRGVALLQLVLMAASGAAAALVPALTAARKQAAGGAAATATTATEAATTATTTASTATAAGAATTTAPGAASAASVADQASSALRFAWWLGGAAAIGLALLASPIDIALFADDAGNAAIRLLAPAAVFGTLQAVSGGLLQGQGDLRGPAVNLAVAAVLKLALNVLLVPTGGIEGAALGMVAAYGAASLLNALSLRQRLAVPPVRLATAWRPAVALAVMAATVALAALALGALAQSLPARAGALLVALPGTAVGGLTLAAALIAAGAIGPQQWRELPGCAPGSRMDARLLRLHALLRRRASETPVSREG